MYRGLCRSRYKVVADVLKYLASCPSPSRSRNFITRSASRKSATPRGCRPSSFPICGPVSRCCPSLLNKSNVTAVSRTLEFQNPKAVCRIASGVGEGVLIETRCSIREVALPTCHSVVPDCRPAIGRSHCGSQCRENVLNSDKIDLQNAQKKPSENVESRGYQTSPL